jgi:hypothetical protein
MSGQDSRPSRFGNLLALRQEKEQRGAATEGRGEALAPLVSGADDSVLGDTTTGGSVEAAQAAAPPPGRSPAPVVHAEPSAPAVPARRTPSRGQSEEARRGSRKSTGEHRGGAPSARHVSGAKRPQSIALYDVNWRWLRDQASGTDFEEGYARASQIAAEILAAAEETGLDVRSARNLEDVRRLALQHFGQAPR